MLTYLDSLAKELASDVCARCWSRMPKSAAMLYEGPEWKYYYCYECRRWFKRHFRFRYAIAPIDDPRTINGLLRRLESDRRMLQTQDDDLSWIRRKISAASRFFQRYLP